MKKMIRNAASVLFTALVATAFAGCSNDDSVINNTPAGNEEAKTAVLTLAFPNTPNSRMMDKPVNDQQALTISDNTPIVFYDKVGRITRKISIIQTGTPDNSSTFSYTDAVNATKGITVKDLDAATAYVAVLANNKANALTGQKWANYVETATTTQAAGYYATQTLNLETVKGESTVNIYGSAELVPPTQTPAAGETPLYTAKVEIASTLARFEITDLAADGIIKSFDVVGVYLDDFFKSAAVDSKTFGDKKVHNMDGTNYAVGKDVYTAINQGTYFDETGASMLTVDTIDTKTGVKVGTSLPGGKVFGYYAFAAPHVAGFDHSSKNGSDVPRIIIKINNVVLKDRYSDSQSLYTGNTYFVTVKGFNFTDATHTTPTVVGSVDAGYVYATSAGAFKVNQDDLKPNPNETGIDATITVKALPWNKVEVTPNI
jgi:hypothetical protein